MKKSTHRIDFSQANFTMVPNDIIDFVKLKPSEFTIYVILLRYDYHNKITKRSKRFVYPSLRTIKSKTRMSNDTIHDALFVLHESGLITRSSVNRTKKDGTESKLKRNVYFLNMPMFSFDELNLKLQKARETLQLLQKINKRRSARRNIFSKDVPHVGMNNVPHAGTEEDEDQKKAIGD